MGIDKVSQIKKLYGPKQTAKVRGPAKAQKAKLKADKLEISTVAKNALQQAEDVKLAKGYVGEASDVREDRIAEVKKRLDNGYYDKPEIVEKVAEKIAHALLNI